MPLLSTLSYSALSGLGGFYAGTALRGRRDNRDTDEFRDDVLAQINERYEAYLELEARITRAIKQFDLTEAQNAREIAQKEERILELERALECSVDQAAAGGGESGLLDEIESALDGLGLEDTAAIDDDGARVALERELAELRAELARVATEKDAEIERQEELIGSLASCVANLEAELESASAEVATTLETSISTVVYGDDSGDKGDKEDSGFGDAEDPLAAISEDVARAFAELDVGSSSPTGSGEAPEAKEPRDAEELARLKQRVEELSPYVQLLADADRRIASLEERCEELRAAREGAVVELRGRVASLEAENGALEAQVKEREALQSKISELSPYVDLLAETRFRVQELEEECDGIRQSREEDVFGLQSRVAELEAEKDSVEADVQERDALREQVAELSPFVQRLEDARARIAELEEERDTARREREESVFSLQSRIAELEANQDAGPDRESLAEELELVREQLGESQEQLVESQQLLSESHGELAEARRELGEAEDKVFKLEQRCETVRKKKDESIAVLRERLGELESVREELAQTESALGELEEKCSSLERSKKRAATTMKKLREDLAETEDMVREVGGDPEALRKEREARRELILSVFDDLDEVLEAMKGQERRLAAVDKVHDQTVREQEREIAGLEGRVHDLYLLMETAEEVIAKLEGDAE